jgi:protein involved in polysaccharide export with SLBB domain
MILLGQLTQHVVKDVDRFGGKPGAGAHWRSARPRARMVGAEYKPEGIDEKQLLSGHCAHHTIAGSKENSKRADSLYVVKLPILIVLCAPLMHPQGFAPRRLMDPPVTVIVATNNSRPISVTGAVKTPVTFRTSSPVTLLEAITRAGGLTPTAGPEIMVTGPASLPRRVRVQALIDNTDFNANPRLSGGEEIRVPEAASVRIVGCVNRPGAIRIEGGVETGIGKMIAMAEGLAPFAGKQAYIYRRNGSGRRKEMSVELSRVMERQVPDVALLANDVLYVPDSRNRRLSGVALEELLLFGGTLGGTAGATPLLELSPSR